MLCGVSVLYPHCTYRQVSDGVWKGPDSLSKRSEVAGQGPDLDILNSPPLSLSDLSGGGGVGGLANWMPGLGGEADRSGPDQDPLMSFRARVLEELPTRRPGDKSVSAEVRLVNTLSVRLELCYSLLYFCVFCVYKSIFNLYVYTGRRSWPVYIHIC